jgi:uncharacterized protein YoxC
LETTITLLIIFTGIVALALLLQALALVAISRKIRDISDRFVALGTQVTRQLDSLTVEAEGLMTSMKATAEKVQAMQESLSAVSQVVQRRIVDVDAFLAEAMDSARLQIAKFQDVIDTSARRIDDTIYTLQTAIVVPVNEVQAVIHGIRTGLDVLFGWRRSEAQRSHHDEEMFIG